MENAWNNDFDGEQKDLAPIMEEEDREKAKGFSCLQISLLKIRNRKSNDANRIGLKKSNTVHALLTLVVL